MTPLPKPTDTREDLSEYSREYTLSRQRQATRRENRRAHVIYLVLFLLVGTGALLLLVFGGRLLSWLSVPVGIVAFALLHLFAKTCPWSEM